MNGGWSGIEIVNDNPVPCGAGDGRSSLHDHDSLILALDVVCLSMRNT